MSIIETTVIVFGTTGIACGALLAIASRVFAIKEDPRIGKVCELLPGANCGGCGYAGCADYAKAIIMNDAPINLCTVGGAETVKKLSTFLGKTAEAAERKVAIVLCRGDEANAPKNSIYNGIVDCSAANLVSGGNKKCRYGCLGYGSCARVCPTGAIEIKDGIAVVHPELCIGCGACVKVCPRKIIKLIPASRKLHVFCSSLDKGPAVKKVCKVGCIGCSLCSKLAPDNAIVMSGALAVVDYSKNIDDEKATILEQKCPGKCIRKT